MIARIIEVAKTLGRNELCDCGSGKKYKKCCQSAEMTGAAKLSADDTAFFFRINTKLLAYVSKSRKKVMVLESEDDMLGFQNFMADMRDICWKKPKDYIRKYLLTDKSLDERERAILEEWAQKYIKDDFFIMDFKPEYAVVMRVDKKNNNKCVLYAVKGLTDSLAHVVKRQKPIIVQMLLLPFEGKIIYDGMLNYLSVDFDEEKCDNLCEFYEGVLKENGITMVL